MMRTDRKPTVLWTAFLLASLGCLAAGPALEAQVASMSALGGHVAWLPQVSYEKLVLRVSGGEFTTQLEFEGGLSPQFAPVDAEGYQLPDGNYTWELTVIPRAVDLRNFNFKSAQMSADGRTTAAAEIPEGLSQSGTFTIVGGAIANPNLPEIGSAPPESARGAEIDDSDAANQ